MAKKVATKADANSGYTYEVVKPSESDVEITVTVDPSRITRTQDKIFAELSKTTEISGFRPGKAPKNVIMEKIYPKVVLATYDRIVPEITTEIVNQEKYRVLGKIAYDFKDNADKKFIFVAKFPVLPEIKLPDFSKLKVKKESADVTKEEIEKVYNEVKEKALENKDKKTEDIEWIKELKLPGVENKEQMEEFIKKSLETTKLQTIEENYLGNLITEAIKLSKLKPSKIATENEIKQKEKSYEERIKKLGISVDDFLKTQNTSIDVLRERWTKEAENALGADMLFLSLANEYDIKVNSGEVASEIAGIQDPKVRMSYQTPQGQEAVFITLFRQKSLQKLKELVEKKN